MAAAGDSIFRMRARRMLGNELTAAMPHMPSEMLCLEPQAPSAGQGPARLERGRAQAAYCTNTLQSLRTPFV